VNSLISIIIPAYNAERYIAETIQSVINQTYKNWELIIVDDGATDGTSKIITSFLHNSRIKYYYQKNSGVAKARNFGILKSSGEYIAVLDADDVWENTNLKKKISLLEKHPNTGWVFSDMLEGDAEMKNIQASPRGRGDQILENILLWEGEVVPGPCSNVVFRRKCITNGIRFDENLSTAADQDFCIQLARAFKGEHIPEPLWVYRVLGNSMSRNIRVMEKEHTYVFNKVAKQKLFRSFWFRQKCFSNLYLILAGSWWKNGKNKFRGLCFIVRSLVAYPPNIIKLTKKNL
jgi:glycosyltransferase involved in cell wall biosynthesis